MALSEKKNRGEWSELYALVKILALGSLPHYVDLNSNQPSHFPVISVSRWIGGGELKFTIKDGFIECLDVEKNSLISNISQDDLVIYAQQLLDGILSGKGRTFAIPSAVPMMAELGISSVTGVTSKDDLRITVYDSHIKQEISSGFSIKSFLGSKPSLLNSSGVTNITYKISGRLETSEVKALNQLGPIPLVRSLVDTNHKLILAHMDQRFVENLKMVDSEMHLLLAEFVLASFQSTGRTTSDVLKVLVVDNPLNYSKLNCEDRYKHKIKDLLEAIALGMRPAEPWLGKTEATGGNLVVAADGKLLCHYALDGDSLRNYLFSHTFVDTPSRKRHNFGAIFGDQLTLNFQIRLMNISAPMNR